MKTSQIVAVLAPAATVQAQWWGGYPGCAANCMTQFWNNPTDWPSAGAICATATPAVAQCVSSACGATPTAWASFSSVSSSLCSQWASCTASGANAVRTLTAGQDGWAGKGWWGYGDNDDAWKSAASSAGFFPGNGRPNPKGKRDFWPATMTSGQVYTVTGCDWNGANGWGWGGQGPFGWGAGWTAMATSTATVTRTYVNAAGSTVTSVGPATIGVAASGSVTSTATLGFVNAQATGSNDAGRNAAGLKAMGAVLGGVVGVAALL